MFGTSIRRLTKTKGEPAEEALAAPQDQFERKGAGRNGHTRPFSLVPARRSLEQIVIELGLVDEEELTKAHALQPASDRELGEVLVQRGLLSPEDLGMVISLQTKIPFVDLKRHDVDTEILALVPENVARKYAVVPLEVVDNSLVLVMEDPDDLEAIQDISAVTKLRIEPALGLRDDIFTAININYKVSGEIDRQVSQIVTPGNPDDQLSAELIAQTPVVRVVDLVLSQAVRDRASDIHIEPQENELRIRFRIDGILHDARTLPLSIHGAMVSRIKVLSGLNIAERRRPQDGQFYTSVEGKDIDIRVATVDTLYGEKMELRILDKALIRYTLTELGFGAENLVKHKRMLNTPYGMILISGPTGSGKTTTLYASINDLHTSERNIITIEDPVEYRFPGITPIQVNSQAGITFSSGLRAVLRLDPDIIMVGEIRDGETAGIAIQAALTGHLVLSSIHANDSVGVLFRLMDLGVEPFLICSALIGVVAQRMVRRICHQCRVRVGGTVEEASAYRQEMGEEIGEYYSGEGCHLCGRTGYSGRITVQELLIVSDEIRRMLLEGAGASDIRARALVEGMISMRRDGMGKVKESITTPSEVLRNVFSIGAVEGSEQATAVAGETENAL